METLTAVREHGFVDFAGAPSGAGCRIGRGQNFVVEWLDASSGRVAAASPHEMLLLLDGCEARIEHAGRVVEAGGRTVCILPAGTHAVTLAGAGAAALIASRRTDVADAEIANRDDYATPDPRIVDYRSAGFRRVAGQGEIQVMPVDGIASASGKPRLKMIQTETLSINWVEYEGGRDRTKLSPHSHRDFEQGSLAIAGYFVHHLRVTWGPDATQWRDDVHVQAAPASLLVVPVNLVHTTEGVGDGRHLLIDVFSPPRRDFIDKGWVANAGDYAAAPEAAGA